MTLTVATTRVRYKLRNGRVAFVRVEDQTAPMRDGWLEMDPELPLAESPAWLALAHGFEGQNTARRLIVALFDVEGLTDD